MGNKKILISLPEALLSEVDFLASEENVRPEQMDQGIRHKDYRQNAARGEGAALWRKATLPMGELNARLAEESIIADNEQLLTYELKLSESE